MRFLTLHLLVLIIVGVQILPLLSESSPATHTFTPLRSASSTNQTLSFASNCTSSEDIKVMRLYCVIVFNYSKSITAEL